MRIHLTENRESTESLARVALSQCKDAGTVAGRLHSDTHNSRYATEAPRTPEFLRELHTGKRF